PAPKSPRRMRNFGGVSKAASFRPTSIVSALLCVTNSVAVAVIGSLHIAVPAYRAILEATYCRLAWHGNGTPARVVCTPPSPAAYVRRRRSQRSPPPVHVGRLLPRPPQRRHPCIAPTSRQ